MNPLQRALIEKLGHDHVFEHVLASDSAAVVLASAQHAAAAKVVAPPTGGHMGHFTADTPALLPEMSRFFGPQSVGTDFVAMNRPGIPGGHLL
jgi:putative restriction endonuclease